MKNNDTNGEILRLAIPNILSNISIPLLGMVDTALMGRLESEIYIGAVALGSIIFNIIYWGFGFLRMGTTGLTAQSYGQEDRKECTAILGRGLLFALGGSVLILALQSVIAWIGFGLLQGGDQYMPRLDVFLHLGDICNDLGLKALGDEVRTNFSPVFLGSHVK